MDASSSEESDQLLDCLVTRKVILRPVLRLQNGKTTSMFMMITSSLYFVLRSHLPSSVERGWSIGPTGSFYISDPGFLVLLLCDP